MTAAQLDLFVAKPPAPRPEARCTGCGHPYSEHANLKQRTAPTRCLNPGCFCDTFDEREWVTGTDLAVLDGGRQYVHLIRSPEDPERMSREAYSKLGLRRDRAPHRKVNETAAGEWSTVIRHYMHGRDASANTLREEKAKDRRREFTFNRMCVELFDVTADVLTATNFEAGLFGLVRRGIVEHTLEAPIAFRLVHRYELARSTWFEYLDGENVWRCDRCNGIVPLNPHIKPSKYNRTDPEPCPACFPDHWNIEREDLGLEPLPEDWYRVEVQP